jgi:predicted ester cyclase
LKEEEKCLSVNIQEPMLLNKNEEVLRRAIERWNSQDLDGYMQMYDPQIDAKGFPGVTPGADSLRSFYEAFWSAFPGSKLTVEEILSEGDKIAFRFIVAGRHMGTLMGIPSTNRDIKVEGITIMQYNENNKCIRRWNQADFLGLMQQLGAMNH